MTNPPAEFREQLLGAQRTTPALREEYRKQVEAILNHRMTPASRIASAAGVAAAVALAAWGAWKLSHSDAPGVSVAWTTYAMLCAACGAIAAWLAVAVVRGTFAWRSYFTVTGVLVGAAGVVQVLALLQGLRDPADPASTFWAVYAGVLLVVCLAWSIVNRIDAARLDAREQALQLESRLADLAERLPPAR